MPLLFNNYSMGQTEGIFVDRRLGRSYPCSAPFDVIFTQIKHKLRHTIWICKNGDVAVFVDFVSNLIN